MSEKREGGCRVIYALGIVATALFWVWAAVTWSDQVFYRAVPLGILLELQAAYLQRERLAGRAA